jgi:hypothetical protein
VYHISYSPVEIVVQGLRRSLRKFKLYLKCRLQKGTFCGVSTGKSSLCELVGSPELKPCIIHLYCRRDMVYSHHRRSPLQTGSEILPWGHTCRIRRLQNIVTAVAAKFYDSETIMIQIFKRFYACKQTWLNVWTFHAKLVPLENDNNTVPCWATYTFYWNT